MINFIFLVVFNRVGRLFRLGESYKYVFRGKYRLDKNIGLFYERRLVERFLGKRVGVWSLVKMREFYLFRF